MVVIESEYFPFAIYGRYTCPAAIYHLEVVIQQYDAGRFAIPSMVASKDSKRFLNEKAISRASKGIDVCDSDRD